MEVEISPNLDQCHVAAPSVSKMLQRLDKDNKYLPPFAVTTPGNMPSLPAFWLTQMRYSITILPYERNHGEWSKELIRKYRIDRLPNLPHDFTSGFYTVEQSPGCIFPLDHDYIPVAQHVIISIYVYALLLNPLL